MAEARPLVDLPEPDASAVLPTSSPFAIREGTRGWPINEMQASGELWRRYHDVRVRFSDQKTEDSVTLGEHLQHRDGQSPRSAWWNVHEDRQTLVGGLPPETDSWFDRLPDSARPPWTWIFVGQNGSGSSLHVDTMCSSAWNGLVSGVKLWTILSPAQSLSLGLLDRSVAGCLPAGDVAYRFEQRPGDLLVVPGGWAHAVRNVGETVAVTGNYVNASNIDVVEAALAAAGADVWLRIASRVRSVME